MAKTIDIEIALMHYLEYLRNIVIPNVYVYEETDMLCITPSGYASGYEIKISMSDLKNDFRKKKYTDSEVHRRYFGQFKYFYYVIPQEMYEKANLLIPIQFGILVYNSHYEHYSKFSITCKRSPEILRNIKWTAEQQLKIAHKGMMRIYNYKLKHCKSSS